MGLDPTGGWGSDQSGATSPVLSLVLPVCNDEARIDRTLRRIAAWLASVGWLAEVIVVDDGSTDGSGETAARWKTRFQSLTVARHHERRGAGAAVRTGVLAATGRFVVAAEVDLAVPIEDAKLLLESLVAGADVAFASRALNGATVRSPRSAALRLAETSYTLVARALIPLGVRDLFSGLQAFRAGAARQIAERARMEGVAWAVEWIALAQRLGLQVIECPTRFSATAGSHGSRPLKDFAKVTDLWAIRSLLSGSTYNKPQKSQDLLHDTSFEKLQH
jgi:dolichyl-phosphate beta-glucosyltransferase